MIISGKINPDDKVDVCLEVKEPPNTMDCERICSGGRPETPIACQPSSNGFEHIDPKKPSITPAFVRSDSIDSRTEENGTNKDDTASIKSRSMSLTSMSSLSIINSNDGKFFFLNFLFYFLYNFSAFFEIYEYRVIDYYPAISFLVHSFLCCIVWIIQLFFSYVYFRFTRDYFFRKIDE